MRRTSGLAPLAIIGAALIAVWVTASGSVPLMGSAPLLLNRGQRELRHQTPPPAADSGVPRRSRSHSVFGSLPFEILLYVGLSLFLLALIGFIVSGVVTYRRRARRDRVAAPAAGEGTFDAGLVPPVLIERAAQQLLALRGGTPRNAVVACWQALEAACAETGSPRFAFETSMEFTARILGRYQVDADAIAVLGRLYREARFSGHELTEGDRDNAIGQLQAIQRGLQRERVGAAAATPAPQDGGGR